MRESSCTVPQPDPRAVTTPTATQQAIQHYIRTGEGDPLYSAWPGDWLEKAERGRRELRGALITEIRRAAAGRVETPLPVTDTVALTRLKVGPMVRGLFPFHEHDLVLNTLERSVVFVTGSTIEKLVLDCNFDGSAWVLGNLYLTSVGASLLGSDAPQLVGFSEETTCYLSGEYFREPDPFADFIVHETAHIFHNCKRSTVGLAETRRKEWLLEISYRMRETFAYACEAYSRILARAANRRDREELAREYRQTVCITDERVDAGTLGDIVLDAASAGNGWKRILAACSR